MSGLSSHNLVDALHTWPGVSSSHRLGSSPPTLQLISSITQTTHQLQEYTWPPKHRVHRTRHISEETGSTTLTWDAAGFRLLMTLHSLSCT
ncbi:hypothetical protein XA68_10788 [Ophiocordyceps unilateralis]|uniref:Uncharacterized protein n=1 Tax=Ophiocordyceps unilateralis TaxID=268505 RepID=A0A2A9PGC4_OPHUN|nr:hypothetical protein XA68_10788 [Ophiocordyceps unilateralis]